jgi:hypothetical protein
MVGSNYTAALTLFFGAQTAVKDAVAFGTNTPLAANDYWV